MSQLAELFVDRAAAAIIESTPGRRWAYTSEHRRDEARDQARAALTAVSLEAGSKASTEAARFLLRDQDALKAGAESLPLVEVVTAVLWLLISLSDRGVDVAALLKWLNKVLAAGTGDDYWHFLAAILEGR